MYTNGWGATKEEKAKAQARARKQAGVDALFVPVEEKAPTPYWKEKRGRDGAEDAIIKGGMEDTDPQGVGRRLRKGLRVYTVGDGKARMGRKKGRARRPPTREEYNMADRFIGAMVGLLPGDPEGEIL